MSGLGGQGFPAFRVYGLGGWDLGCRGLGFRGLGGWGLGCRGWGLGCRVDACSKHSSSSSNIGATEEVAVAMKAGKF